MAQGLLKVERMNRILKAFWSSVVLLAMVTPALAEPSQAKDLPKKGVLSVSGGGGGQDYKIPGEWAGQDATTGDAPPVSGSVSRINKESWQVKMFNNSKDVYSASIAVIQYDEAVKQIKSDYFSITLKPGEKDVRTFSAAAGSKTAELNLQRWKNLTPHKKETPGAGAPNSEGSSK